VVPCTWLAAYPRSGTTWVRFLVHDLLAGPVARSSDLDRIVPPMPVADDRRSWLDHPGLLATHQAPPAPHQRSGPHLHGFVHVLRHPADALLSEARYHCLRQSPAIAHTEGGLDPDRLDRLLLDYLDEVSTDGCTDEHRRLGTGSWAEHTSSWLAARDAHPHVVIRYEDLARDPEGEVRRLATFLRQSPPDDEIRRIVYRCSAASLRRMQEDEIARRDEGRFYEGGRFHAAYDVGLRFLGPARRGEGESLDPRVRSRIDERFGATMARVGYRTAPADRVFDVPSLKPVAPLSAEAVEELGPPVLH